MTDFQAADASSGGDLDLWLEWAIDDSMMDGRAADPLALAALWDRLLEVLGDEEASFVPPVAGPITQEQWKGLPASERQSAQRAQLSRLDPRLIARTIQRLKPRSRDLGAR